MPGTQVFDPNFQLMLDQHAANAEVLLEAAVLFYSGEIHYKYNPEFKLAVEELKKHGPCTDRIAVFLTTGGGIPEAAEMMVTILRKHYEEVFFVVPHHAMSAGTMICMSGNKILMEYSSMLGPIDPQVPTPDQQGYVPALGYIDKVEELHQRLIDRTERERFVILLFEDQQNFGASELAGFASVLHERDSCFLISNNVNMSQDYASALGFDGFVYSAQIETKFLPDIERAQRVSHTVLPRIKRTL